MAPFNGLTIAKEACMKDLKRILVPTDLSKFSTVAFEYAKFLAKTFDADLFILHVVEETPVVSAYSMDLSLPAVAEELTKQAEVNLNEFVKAELGSVARLHVEVRRGNPFTEICKYADEYSIGLIIVATHGRTGLAHMVMGSTAERIVQRAHAPVLAVKPEEVKQQSSQRRATEDVAKA